MRKNQSAGLPGFLSVLFVLALLELLFPVASGRAQIALDGTMGQSGTLQGPNYTITQGMGKLVGTNLFQSFGVFNVNTGESATFTGTSSITNVISRVTGGGATTIDGKLGCSIPGANLYFINPSGVMFGPNATLDISGSFAVSSADYLKLSDGGKFSATNPPDSSLTVAPPSAFGFLGSNPGGIKITGGTLAVSNGKTVSLIGGDVTVTDGTVYAPGGRINVVSAASAGETSLSDSGVSTSGITKFGSISISNTTYRTGPVDSTGFMDVRGNLDASGDGGGAIYIVGGRFVMDKVLVMANTRGAGSGGKIDVSVDTLTLNSGSQINTMTTSTGNGGNININAGNSVAITGYTTVGAYIYPSSINNASLNSGSGGLITVTTPLLAMDNYGYMMANSLKSGNSGSILLNVGSLSIGNGSTLTTGIAGSGQGGNITINATGDITVSNGAILSETLGTGRAGDIIINANNLAITGGGIISTSTSGYGKGGDLSIKANNNITISGDGSGLFCGTLGNSNAESISIETGNLQITEGGAILTSTYGAGTGGNLSIKASDTVTVSGNNSKILSETYGAGNAGSISIETGNLQILDSGQVSTSSYAAGNGGDIAINAKDTVTISGNHSLLASDTSDKGNAGSISVTTTNLNIAGGGGINAATDNPSGNPTAGNGGSITVKATGAVTISGSSEIAADTLDQGNAGNIIVETGSLTLTDGGFIATASSESSTGNGGNITVKANDTVTISGASIASSTLGKGNAGNIIVETGNLVLTGGGFIDASTGPLSTGNGGNITIKANEGITISGQYIDPSGNIDSGLSSTTSGTGNGGTIIIDSGYVNLSDNGEISSSSIGSGNAGNIELNVGGTLKVSYADISAFSLYTSGGNIVINGRDVMLLDDSLISTKVFEGSKNGGNISIQSKTLTVVNQSQVSADAYNGFGGNITINSDGVFLWSKQRDNALHASSNISGNEGNVTVNSPVTDISGALAQLKYAYLNAGDMLPETCFSRNKQQRGTFTVTGGDGLPPAPGESW